MPIPRDYTTSNPVVRDALAEQPLPFALGTREGDFVSPDYPVDSEIVDAVTMSTHALNLDDIRAADAEAKQIRFEADSAATLSVVERALKTTIDSRKVEEAASRGVQVIAQRLSYLRDDILDAKEYRKAALVMTAANYAAGHKDVTGLNFRTIDLQEKADIWADAIATDGNVQARYGMIGKLAWRHARRNATFREYAAGTDAAAGAADLTLANFASFMGLDEVRLGNYSRVMANATTPTQFWTTDSFLMFSRQQTISNRTLSNTIVVPYGQAQGATAGTLVDARTDLLSGTERLTEIGAYHRYRSYLRNASLGFLVTAIVGA